MDNELTRYINDHLAGSSGALLLIKELAENHDIPEASEFFTRLHGHVLEDRTTLEGLLEQVDKAPSALLKAAGGVAARVGGLKLMWEKVEPGHLGMFEALEMLALGIQGKRLLWVVCGEISPWFPEWAHMDFAALEAEALRQRDEVEKWRIAAGLDSLVDAERKPIKTA